MHLVKSALFTDILVLIQLNDTKLVTVFLTKVKTSIDNKLAYGVKLTTNTYPYKTLPVLHAADSTATITL